ncbi:MAG: NAD(P)H-dependent glycerol-3-phosphate dehydrogenase [Spirochaetaceae bacterium]|jgi:glycerol-3-phosphate dehydrogenase (NAD(P)+)|nr:NAD(P)H-dependent glycerol-3-phosphate dehydrogenase [Spirochaetaceae bacterium]
MRQVTAAVIGAGAWGTAIAKVIAGKGCKTDLWCRREEQAAEINSARVNSRYLPDVRLPECLSATSDIAAAANGKDFLILAVPSLFLLDKAKELLTVPSIREGQTSIGIITKGFLESSAGPRLIIDTLEDYMPGFYRGKLVYISGPSHAEEVARGTITGLIAASQNARESIRFRYLLKTQNLFVFSSLDARGVQVAAAAKNIIAIAFGVFDALKSRNSRVPSAGSVKNLLGDNTGSLLLAAGLSEIQLLGRAMGATHAETFTSIAGVGDLDVTCRSVYGRNRRFGREIIEKKILDPFKDIDDLIARIAEIGYMPEGIAASRHVNRLQEKYRLKMPLCSIVYSILNRGTKAEDALNSYLNRAR